MKNIPRKADDKPASSGLNAVEVVPDGELDIQEEGLNLLERTFASAYRKADEIDPDEEASALILAVRLISAAPDRQINGRSLIEKIKGEGCILSLKDVARVLHRGWKNNFLHRKTDPEMAGTKRTGFIYWVDETNRPVSMIAAESLLESSFDDSEQKAPEMIHAEPNTQGEWVHWLSSDGKKLPFSGQKIADIPAGASAYVHLENVPRGLYARNFKDVAGFDRVLVHSLEKGRYYAPAAHGVSRVQPNEETPRALDAPISVAAGEDGPEACPPQTEDVRKDESKKGCESPVLDEAAAVALPALEDSFLASHAAAQAWSMRTGQAWPASFMSALIEQAVREASQVRIEREHHRAVRRIVLAQTELMRAAILIDESASYQETLDF